MHLACSFCQRQPTLFAAPFHLFPGTNRPAGGKYLRMRKRAYCQAVFIASNADSKIVLCIPFLPKLRLRTNTGGGHNSAVAWQQQQLAKQPHEVRYYRDPGPEE